MFRSMALLITIAALAVFALCSIVLGDGITVVRLAAGTLLVLVLPGYALLMACVVRTDVDTAVRFALGIGYSLAIATVSGFLLHWTPFGLEPGIWATVLAGITLVAVVIAMLRRLQATAPIAPRSSAAPFNVQALSFYLLAVIMTVGAFELARYSASTAPQQPFTQFWLLPGDTADQELRIGILNAEAVEMTYRIQLLADQAVVQTWEPIHLQPDQQWNTTTAPIKANIVQAHLYRVDQPDTVYRNVILR